MSILADNHPDILCKDVEKLETMRPKDLLEYVIELQDAYKHIHSLASEREEMTEEPGHDWIQIKQVCEVVELAKSLNVEQRLLLKNLLI